MNRWRIGNSSGPFPNAFEGAWKHTGFSVDKSVRIAAGAKAGIERLSQYAVRCPFSLDRIVSVNEQGQVVYRAEKPAAVKYPLFGDERLRAGTRRNFEVFDPLDFIAEITQHPPSPFGLRRAKHSGQGDAAHSLLRVVFEQDERSEQDPAPLSSRPHMPESANKE